MPGTLVKFLFRVCPPFSLGSRDIVLLATLYPEGASWGPLGQRRNGL